MGFFPVQKLITLRGVWVSQATHSSLHPRNTRKLQKIVYLIATDKNWELMKEKHVDLVIKTASEILSDRQRLLVDLKSGV